MKKYIIPNNASKFKQYGSIIVKKVEKMIDPKNDKKKESLAFNRYITMKSIKEYFKHKNIGLLSLDTSEELIPLLVPFYLESRGVLFLSPLRDRIINFSQSMYGSENTGKSIYVQSGIIRNDEYVKYIPTSKIQQHSYTFMPNIFDIVFLYAENVTVGTNIFNYRCFDIGIYSKEIDTIIIDKAEYYPVTTWDTIIIFFGKVNCLFLITADFEIDDEFRNKYPIIQVS